MESIEISPVRIRTFARHLILAARKQEARKSHISDISAHIEKIKKYARNPRIRKETLQQEINVLRSKVSEVVRHHDPFVASADMEDQFRGRVGELENHLNQVDQRLLLDEQRRNAQLDMLVQRLDTITGTMGALCKRLHVAPPKAKPIQEKPVRGKSGKFVKKGLPPTQSVFSFGEKAVARNPPTMLVHSWAEKHALQIKELRKQLAGLQLQYHNLKKRGKHDPTELKEIAAYIERLREKVKILER